LCAPMPAVAGAIAAAPPIPAALAWQKSSLLRAQRSASSRRATSSQFSRSSSSWRLPQQLESCVHSGFFAAVVVAARPAAELPATAALPPAGAAEVPPLPPAPAPPEPALLCFVCGSALSPPLPPAAPRVLGARTGGWLTSPIPDVVGLAVVGAACVRARAGPASLRALLELGPAPPTVSGAHAASDAATTATNVNDRWRWFAKTLIMDPTVPLLTSS